MPQDLLHGLLLHDLGHVLLGVEVRRVDVVLIDGRPAVPREPVVRGQQVAHPAARACARDGPAPSVPRRGHALSRRWRWESVEGRGTGVAPKRGVGPPLDVGSPSSFTGLRMAQTGGRECTQQCTRTVPSTRSNGGKWGGMGGNGGEWGGMGGSMVLPPHVYHVPTPSPHFPPLPPHFPHPAPTFAPIFLIYPISPLPPFPPIPPHFSSGAFTNATPPPPTHTQPCCQSKPWVLAFSAPTIVPTFPLGIQNLPHCPPVSPIFPKSAHFEDSCTVTVRERAFLGPAFGSSLPKSPSDGPHPPPLPGYYCKLLRHKQSPPPPGATAPLHPGGPSPSDAPPPPPWGGAYTTPELPILV